VTLFITNYFLVGEIFRVQLDDKIFTKQQVKPRKNVRYSIRIDKNTRDTRIDSARAKGFKACVQEIVVNLAMVRNDPLTRKHIYVLQLHIRYTQGIVTKHPINVKRRR